MTRPGQTAAAALLGVALLLAGAAAAHDEAGGQTLILFNERSGNLEVMHRFAVHDAEHFGSLVLGAKLNLVGSVADRKRFAALLADQLALADGAGGALVLTRVGEQIDGAFLWVYAEAPIPASGAALTVRLDAGASRWPSPQQEVMVERKGRRTAELMTPAQPVHRFALYGAGQ